jgi:hypothetical protein
MKHYIMVFSAVAILTQTTASYVGVCHDGNSHT